MIAKELLSNEEIINSIIWFHFEAIIIDFISTNLETSYWIWFEDISKFLL